MAFHSVSTLSSRPGRTRRRRADQEQDRARLDASAPTSGAPTGRSQDGGPLEVPRRGDAEPRAHGRRPPRPAPAASDGRGHLVGRPDVEPALTPSESASSAE